MTLGVYLGLLTSCGDRNRIVEDQVSDFPRTEEYKRGGLLEIPLVGGSAIARADLDIEELSVWNDAGVDSIIYGGALGIGVRDYSLRKEWERKNIEVIKSKRKVKVSGSINLFFIYPPYNFNQYEYQVSLGELASEASDGRLIFLSDKYFVCFHKPQYINFLKWWVKDQSLNANFDGMHLDWPEITAFPNVDCECSYCLKKWETYSQKYQLFLSLKQAIASNDRESKYYYKKFRLDSVLNAIEELNRHMDSSSQNFRLDITTSLRADSMYLMGNSRDGIDVAVGENTNRASFAPEGEQVSFYKIAYGMTNQKAVGSLDYYGSWNVENNSYREVSEARANIYMAEVLAMEGFTWLGWLGSPIQNIRSLLARHYDFRRKYSSFYENTEFVGNTVLYISSDALLYDERVLTKYLEISKLLHKLKIQFKVVNEKEVLNESLTNVSNFLVIGNKSVDSFSSLDVATRLPENTSLMFISEEQSELNLEQGTFDLRYKYNFTLIGEELNIVNEKNALTMTKEEVYLKDYLGESLRGKGIHMVGTGSENVTLISREIRDYYIIHLINYNADLHVGWRWEDQLVADKNIQLNSLSIDVSSLLGAINMKSVIYSLDNAGSEVDFNDGVAQIDLLDHYAVLVIKK